MRLRRRDDLALGVRAALKRLGSLIFLLYSRTGHPAQRSQGTDNQSHLLLIRRGVTERLVPDAAQEPLLVEGADKGDVEVACLFAGVLGIFFQNKVEAHAEAFTERGDDTARAVFALITVYQDRLVLRIHQDRQRFSDLLDSRTPVVALVWCDGANKVLDASFRHEIGIRGRKILVDQGAATTARQSLAPLLRVRRAVPGRRVIEQTHIMVLSSKSRKNW